jgi:hypothetical protein
VWVAQVAAVLQRRYACVSLVALLRAWRALAATNETTAAAL